MDKTISYLNKKTWYRFLKVFFIFIFLSVIGISNSIIFDNDSKRLDLNKSIVICNKSFGGIESHKLSLKETGIYFGDDELENYTYKNFVQNNKHSALILANKCIEGNKYGATIADLETTIETPYFEINIVYSYSQIIKNFFIVNIIIIIVFESIKRAFYYITLGTVIPKKE